MGGSCAQAVRLDGLRCKLCRDLARKPSGWAAQHLRGSRAQAANFAGISRASRPAGRLAAQNLRGSCAQAVRLDGLRQNNCWFLACKPSSWTACGGKVAGCCVARPSGSSQQGKLLCVILVPDPHAWTARYAKTALQNAYQILSFQGARAQETQTEGAHRGLQLRTFWGNCLLSAGGHWCVHCKQQFCWIDHKRGHGRRTSILHNILARHRRAGLRLTTWVVFALVALERGDCSGKSRFPQAFASMCCNPVA